MCPTSLATSPQRRNGPRHESQDGSRCKTSSGRKVRCRRAARPCSEGRAPLDLRRADVARQRRRREKLDGLWRCCGLSRQPLGRIPQCSGLSRRVCDTEAAPFVG